MRLRAFLAAAAALVGLPLAAAPPLQPKLDATGNFVHDPSVAVTLMSLSADGVTLECRQPTAPGGEQIWRERYVVKDGKLALAGISLPTQVPDQPAHTEWRETTVHETSAPATAPDKVAGTDLRGAMVDPRWASYPEYMHGVVETIERTWDHERITQKLNARTGNRVSVKFVLDAQGAVTRIDNVEYSPGMADAAVRACVAAITGPAPYPPWTAEMVATLGAEQTLNLAFYYP